jgi:hypothetical protein
LKRSAAARAPYKEGRHRRVNTRPLPIRFHDRWFTRVLAISIALALIGAILLAPVPISLDGASHIYSALVIRHLVERDPLFSRYFQLNSLLIPNWLASAILALTATASSDTWSMGFITLATIALMFAALYFLVKRAGDKPDTSDHELYILTALAPLAASSFVFAGFWGFLLSMALCFFAAGFLYSDHPPASNRIVVAALVLLAFWAHPVPVLLTAFFPVWIYASSAVRSLRSGFGGLGTLTARFLLDVWPWAVAAALILRFTGTLVHLRIGSDQTATGGSTVGGRITDLFRAGALAAIAPSGSVSGLFILFIAALLIGTVLSGSAAPKAAASSSSKNSFRADLAVFCAVLCAAYFLLPDRIGNGTEITSRVLLMALSGIAVLALTGGLATDVRYLRLCASLAALIVAGTCGEYLLVSWRLAPAVRELKEAMVQVPPRSTILLLGYRLTPDCGRWWPLVEETMPDRHWGLLGAIPRDAIVLNDYEPATQHFPVEYRSRRYASIENEFTFTPREIAAWNEALDNAREVDYVVSWGVPSPAAACKAWVPAPLEENLEREYRKGSEYHQRSRVQIWRRSNSESEGARR